MIRVLVVEDQALFLGALASLIDLETDFEIVGKAKNGKAAYQMVETCQPDLIITDIEMPEMSGIDLALRLKLAGRKYKILIVTTFGRSGYLQRALDAGVNGYVLKDTPSEQLAAIVRKVMAGTIYVSPELRGRPETLVEDPLSEREREILRLVEIGLSNGEIAEKLQKATGTIRNNLHEATQKIGCRNRIEAARISRSNGWL